MALPFRIWGARHAGRVSVVVPLYNHAAYIGQAVHSVLSQGAVVRELIVIDDGSTDDSAAVMEGLARTDPRIRFRRQRNQGAHAALNAGLAEASGELVAILNSDDAYEPDRLTGLASLLDERPEAELAASRISFIDGGGRTVANPWYAEALAFHQRGAEAGVALVNANFLMTTSNFMMRRGLLHRLGGFAALRYGHDLDFALRTLAYGIPLAMLDQPLLRYRIHGANTISEDHRAVRADWAVAAAAYLTCLWDRLDAPPLDWAHARAVQDVLQRHELSRAVALCMAYLRRHGAGPLDRSPLLHDAAMLARLREWV